MRGFYFIWFFICYPTRIHIFFQENFRTLSEKFQLAAKQHRCLAYCLRYRGAKSLLVITRRLGEEIAISDTVIVRVVGVGIFGVQFEVREREKKRVKIDLSDIKNRTPGKLL